MNDFDMTCELCRSKFPFDPDCVVEGGICASDDEPDEEEVEIIAGDWNLNEAQAQQLRESGIVHNHFTICQNCLKNIEAATEDE